jgi:transcriptional regulator with XRE-family HTH domain
MDFYERVKYLVKEKNFSLIPFLESIGINYGTYKAQRRYNNLPRADEAVKIAKALNTTVEYLVTGENQQQNPIMKTELLNIIHLLEKQINNL